MASSGSTPSQRGFPDYRSSVALKYVTRGFRQLVNNAFAIILIPIAGFLGLELVNLYQNGDLIRLWEAASQTDLTFNLITAVGCTTLLAAALISYFLLQKRPVYLLDFSVYRAPDSWAFTYDRFNTHSQECGKFTEESLVFQSKIVARSGLGQETYLPPAIAANPACPTMVTAREEFETVMFSVVEDLLKKTGVHAKDIGVIVVNCSLFNPTPSLAAMVINHFKLSSNIISYNLGGMGCSASPVAIDLARQLLQLQSGTYALVLSNENITQNWYPGNERAFLLPNCIFRVGGAAMLLSSKRRDSWRAKYELSQAVRTQMAGSEAAYGCVYQTEDPDGVVGVRLSKELMAVAGEALKVNITTLGPLVLPVSEQLFFFANLVRRKIFGRKSVKPYIPNFSTAFEHACIHTGGRAVIDEIEKQLCLPSSMIEPSRAALYRYGNTSSASIWYVLAYIESQKVGVRRGDRVWQLAFGSGFKCNSLVWRAMKNVKDPHFAWEGFSVDGMRAHLDSLPNHHYSTKSPAGSGK
ncbi:MAG: hypothetical protein WDW38_008855 [Sanguina aurantia]